MSAPFEHRALGDAEPSPAGEPIRVLFCCDPGYYQHLSVALVSLLENNARHALEIHLITNRTDPIAEAKLSASLERYGNFSFHTHRFSSRRTQGWHTSFHITSEAYIRLFAPGILGADIDRIIYLDADLVVVGDLEDLWATDLEGHALAAVPDPFGAYRKAALGMSPSAPYVNSGVMLLSLATWRQKDVSARLFAYIDQAGGDLLFHDQDAINAVLASAIKPLDYRWNFQAKLLPASRFSGLPDAGAIAQARPRLAIVHFTSSRKPWLFVMATPGKRLYRRYLQMTEWRDTPSIGRTWRSGPEFCVNHLLYHLGIDYTWDRMLRSTTLGRGLDRLLRLTARPGATAT